MSAIRWEVISQKRRLIWHEVPQGLRFFQCPSQGSKVVKDLPAACSLQITPPISSRQQSEGDNSCLSRRFRVRRSIANKQTGGWFCPQPRQGELEQTGMRLATMSIIAARGAINEFGHVSTLEVVGKLTTATICRDANFSPVMLDLTQKIARAAQRSHAFQVAALKVVALGRHHLLTCFSGKPGRDLHRLDRASFAWRTHSITSSKLSAVRNATVERRGPTTGSTFGQ
jgi:hypothetical protein